MARTDNVQQERHFADEDGLDFARQLGTQDEKLRRARHLEAGCPRCAETVRFWRSVLGLASHAASYRPPDAVSGQVKAQFALHKPKGLLERAAQRASLVFDSFRQPFPVGVRAAGPSPRQLLYQAGPYVIRLRIEPAAGSDRVSVIGQVVDEANPRRPLPDLPVLVLRGKDTVDRTLTNLLGEFEVEPASAEDLRLALSIPGTETLTVPLPVGRGGERDGVSARLVDRKKPGGQR